MSLFKKKSSPMPRSCPFCGGIPKISKCGDHRDLWYVRCTECCETPIDWSEAKVNIDDAIRVYNKRADFAEHLIRIYNRVKSKETINEES